MPDKQLPFDSKDFADILGEVPEPTPAGVFLPKDRIHDPLELHPVRLYLAGLSTENSQRTQKQALDKMAHMLGSSDALSMDWSKIRYQHTKDLRTQLIYKYAPATVNKFLAALRSVLKQAFLSGQMKVEDYQQVIRLESVENKPSTVGRILSTEEISALMKACDDGSRAGVRDAAVIGLLYGVGLGRAEIVSLDLRDYFDGILIVKSNERIVNVSQGAIDALEDWIALRGDEKGPLFLAINKGDNLRAGKRLTSQAIYGILVKRGGLAGIRKFSPQDLRRTFISHMLDTGTDIAIVAKMAGHRDVKTTMRYDKRPALTHEGVGHHLHVPYKKRR